jgi:hypothetical protein
VAYSQSYSRQFSQIAQQLNVIIVDYTSRQRIKIMLYYNQDKEKEIEKNDKVNER